MPKLKLQPKPNPTHKLNPVKKSIVKNQLKLGKDATEALTKAGYKPNTVKHSTSTKVVQVCYDEIKKELKAEEYTIELLVERLEKFYNRAVKANDLGAEDKAIDKIGRFLSAWKDRTVSEQTVRTEHIAKDVYQFRQNRLEPDRSPN